MEVILCKDFPSLGYVGDKVKVKPGYARNYLLPRGIALEALSRNEAELKHKLGGVSARRIKLRGAAEELKTKLEEVVLEFTLKMGSSGKSFGSVSHRDIEAALKEKGFVLDKKQIVIHDAIRKTGEHKISIKLHSEVSASIPVKVQSDKAQAEAAEKKEEKAEAKEEKKARKPRAKKAKAAEGAEESAEAPAKEETSGEPTETK